MEEKKSIFRKQALDRISSPEDLDNYLVVTKPGIWFVLIAIIVLLIGTFSWMILGRLETSINVAVISSDNQVMCLVPSEKSQEVINSGTVTIAKKEYSLKDVGLSPQLITDETDINICIAGGLEENTLVLPLAVETSLPEGIYSGNVVIETVKPIKFILN